MHGRGLSYGRMINKSNRFAHIGRTNLGRVLKDVSSSIEWINEVIGEFKEEFDYNLLFAIHYYEKYKVKSIDSFSCIEKIIKENEQHYSKVLEEINPYIIYYIKENIK